MPATFSRATARVAASLVLTIIVIIAIASLGLASASGPYNVQSGDTLYHIAGKMGVSEGNLGDWVEEVVAINGLTSPDALKVGQQLTLPAPGSVSQASRTSSSSLTRSSSTPYTIKSGDTLYDVAARKGVSDASLSSWIDSVLKLNDLSSADSIREGEELKLPVQTSAPGSAASTVPANTAARTTSTSRYTVRAGDTLLDIAALSGVADASYASWIDSVLTLNNLSSADSIHQGEELKLPAPASNASTSSAASGASARPISTVQYTVQDGDTLYGIAIQNGVAEAELSSWIDSVLKLNNLSSPDLLALGEALKVPPRAGAASASAGGTAATPKPTAKTITYVVKPGDTLYDIGLKNTAGEAAMASWIDIVLSLNGLSTPDVLREGASLKLPAPPAANSASASAVPAADPSLFVSTGNMTYNVRTGDTWSGIAGKLNIPEAQVASWIDQAVALSHVGRDERLVEGIVLLVPSPNPAAPAIPSPDVKQPSPGPARSRPTTEYTVQSGDTLSDISAKFKVGFGQLSGWIRDVLDINRLGSADMLKVGQTLVVPGELSQASATAGSAPPASNTAQGATTVRPPTSAATLPQSAVAAGVIRGPNNTCFYTVLAGDTWDGIAQKLGVSAESKSAWIDGIRALNNVSGNALPVGDALRMLC